MQFLTHTPKKFEDSIGDSLIITQFYLVHQHHFDGQYVDYTKIKSIFIRPCNIHILFSVTILVQQKIEMTVCFILEHLLLFPAILLDIPEYVVE